MTITEPGADQPSWLSPAAKEMQATAKRCRDVRGATEVMRREKATYFPMMIAEDKDDYKARVDMTVVMDFFEQAVTTLVGLGLRHDAELGKKVPEEIQANWENLDGEGNHGAVLVQDALDISLTDGHVVYFTEAPPPNNLDAGTQQAIGHRPYTYLISLFEIPSWRVGVIGGRKVLLQLVHQVSSEEPAGEFGSTTVTRYRVYRQKFRQSAPDADGKTADDLTQPYVTWELWEPRGATAAGQTPVYTMTNSGEIKGPRWIPARIAYGGKRLGILKSKPPLDGLAHSNVRWAQVMSDRAYSLHKCGIPIPVIIGKLVGAGDGAPSQEVVLSPSKALQVEAGGDAKIIEAAGTALEQTRLELQDWEKRMGSQAIAMLQRDAAAAESATAHRLNRGREESKLARALRSHEDALEGVLQDHAAYHGLDLQRIDVTIRRDFGDIVPPEVLQLLSSLEEKGQLTLPRLLTELQRAGLFSQDFVAEEEAEALQREEEDPDPDEDAEELEDEEVGADA